MSNPGLVSLCAGIAKPCLSEKLITEGCRHIQQVTLLFGYRAAELCLDGSEQLPEQLSKWEETRGAGERI